MITLDVRNVNGAFREAVHLFKSPSFGRRVSPRGMTTIEAEGPVITHYRKPQERVLFDPVRDANPFLHFFGSLWMLAGRNDVKFLSEFAPRMKDFSDDGKTLGGAYGHRWVQWFKTDQLNEVMRQFTDDPDTRRAVLNMWDPAVDAFPHKDVPCNTHVYFKLRDNHLDMTVCCRSNDMIWGCYGTDVVDFSMLQEYITCKLEVDIGTYTHLSDSFHVYEPPHPSGNVWKRVREHHSNTDYDHYEHPSISPYSIGAEDPAWDEDLQKMFLEYDLNPVICFATEFKTEFFNKVVAPMSMAWFTKHVPDLCTRHASFIAASDWRKAAMDWLERRQK